LQGKRGRIFVVLALTTLASGFIAHNAVGSSGSSPSATFSMLTSTPTTQLPTGVGADMIGSRGMNPAAAHLAQTVAGTNYFLAPAASGFMCVAAVRPNGDSATGCAPGSAAPLDYVLYLNPADRTADLAMPVPDGYTSATVDGSDVTIDNNMLVKHGIALGTDVTVTIAGPTGTKTTTIPALQAR
jgi:hypothetical protein